MENTTHDAGNTRTLESLTREEADKLIANINAAVNARPATIAEVDALAASTKSDLRNLAAKIDTVVERVDQLARSLSTILQPQRDPAAGNGGGRDYSPRLDKIEAMAKAALDVARSLEAQPTVDMKPAREAFQSIRRELESGISAGRTDAEAIFAGVPDSRVVGVINARELNSADMRRAVPPKLLELAADLVKHEKFNPSDKQKAEHDTKCAALRVLILDIVRGLVK